MQDLLFVWRKKIFSIVFTSALVAASIPYFLNVKIALATGQMINVVIFTAAYITAFIITFWKTIPFKVRAWSGLSLFYLMGIVGLVTLGPEASGRMWLFMFAILTTLILGLRAGIIAVSINTVTMSFWIWAWSGNHLSWSEHIPFILGTALATVFSFFFMNAVVTISLGIFVKALEKGFKKEKDLSDDLKLSNEELLRENEERKKAEASLRQSEQKYRLLADNVNDIIWVLDIGQQCITYISPSVKKIRGYTPEEAMAQSLEEMLTPDSYSRVVQVLTDELANDNQMDRDRSIIMELEQNRKDGSTVWTEIMASFVRDDENRPTAVLGITRDITERREAEQALREKEEKLARSRKMESLGLMAGGIAHDLNNILSGIVGYPDLLLMDLPEGSPIRKPVEIIKASGERASSVVADLLTVARGVATGKEVLKLNTLVEEYMGSAEQKNIEARNPSITLKTDLDPELLNIRCSETHIKKSLMNLILNAVEAVRENGTVTISTRNIYLDEPLKGYEEVRRGEYALLTVSDDGIGIPPEHLERIFEPFYSKKMMDRSGTGLGLSIVWNSIQDHDGYINVISSMDGTKFELYIPATRTAVEMEKDVLQNTVYQGHGQKILVVDDEGNQRLIACELLTRLGFHAEAVSSGEEAIAYLKENTVDLILLDMIMPKGLNGHETYEQIIKIHPNQKAIIASGYAESEDVKAAQQLGAGGYIKKPYTLDRLGLVLKNELDR